jgi:hypothetical protein
MITYLVSPLERPTLVFIGSIGLACLFWHNAALWFQQGMRQR